MVWILTGNISIDTIYVLIAYFFAVVISITIHGYAIAAKACSLGDSTPIFAKRLTLNPLKNVDWLSSICLLLYGFGWVKPVSINPLNFENLKRDSFMAQTAGIIANFFFAFFSAGIYVLVQKLGGGVTAPFWNFCISFILALSMQMTIVNLSLVLFNLIPVPPLDSYFAFSVFSRSNSKMLQTLEKYSRLILLIIVVSVLPAIIINNAVKLMITPLINFWYWVM